MLEEEVAFFNANRADWLQKQQNRVALIKGRELIGMFDTEEQAIMEGGAPVWHETIPRETSASYG